VGIFSGKIQAPESSGYRKGTMRCFMSIILSIHLVTSGL
jgi:hypothetical protein